MKAKRMLYSIGRAAAAMGVGAERIKRLIEEGKLGVCMVETKPMIPFSELRRYIRENTVAVVQPAEMRKLPAVTVHWFNCGICGKYDTYEREQIDRVPVCRGCKRLRKNSDKVKEIRHNTPSTIMRTI